MISLDKNKEYKFTVNGQTYVGEYLGEGSWVRKAIKLPNDEVYLFVNSFDKSRMALCEIEHIHIPYFRFLGTQKNGEDVYITYYSKTYGQQNYINNEDILNEIRECWFSVCYKYKNRKDKNSKRLDVFMKSIIKINIPFMMAEALYIMVEKIINYSFTVGLEFLDFNLGIDKNNNLIFRDIFFPVINC